MRLLRVVVVAASAFLMAGGYIASQLAYVGGLQAARKYAQDVDTPTVQLIALAILVACVALTFIQDPAEEQS